MAERNSGGGTIVEERGWDGLRRIDPRLERAIVGALLGQDLSGFEIWRWIGSDRGTEGPLVEADLYPELYRLEAEGLLESDWHEAERIRRKYRLTATALREAEANGWPAVVLRDEPYPVYRPSRTHSPDPDAGSWFVPPKPEAAPAAAAFEAPGTPTAGPIAATPDRTRVPGSTVASTAAPAGRTDPAIAGYEDDLAARIDLPGPEADRVRQEISDHLTDSAHSLVLGGMDPRSAVGAAIEGLGDPHRLAARIVAAEQTPERQGRAIRRAVLELVSEMLLWLALSIVVFVLAPGFADIVAMLGAAVGIHLTVLRSAEWSTNQAAIMLCIGAFAAARMSLGWLTRIGRHADASVRKRWAIVGAIATLALALLLPGYQDGLVVLTLLAAPFAFVAGTFRPTHPNESAYTWRGLSQAVLLIAVVTLLPLGRLFAYDPASTPGAPAPPGQSVGELTINRDSDGAFFYTTPSSGDTALIVEFWPASISGPFVVVDPTASAPVLVTPEPVDFANLPAYPQWWIVGVRTGTGGRTAAAMVIQVGRSPGLGTALGWLLSHI